MKTTKMSLASIQGKLSRAEMKNIMAGSGSDNCPTDCNSNCIGTCRCHGYNTGYSYCDSK